MKRALKKINVLREDSPASQAQLNDAVEQLNLIVKELDVIGLGFWVVLYDTFTTVSGQREYTVSDGIPDDIFFLEDAYWQDNSTERSDDLQLTVVDHVEMEAHTDKSSTGTPQEISITEEADPADRTIRLWLTPDVARTVNLVYKRRIYDFDDSTAEPDFPGQYFNYLVYRLASDMADDYAEVTDAKADRLFNKSEIFLRRVRGGSHARVDSKRLKREDY